MSKQIIEELVEKSIRESTEKAAKKGITESIEGSVEKAVKETLNESMMDGTQKAVKEAIEKNVDVAGKLKNASDNLKGKMRVDPDVKSSMFSKLPDNLKQFLNNSPGTWDEVYNNSIGNTNFDTSFKDVASKNINVGELSSRTTADFKVTEGQSTSIKADTKRISKELDADPDYREKSLDERKAGFEKLQRGEVDLSNDAKLKTEVKSQGRGLFRASKSTIGAVIAAVAFFSWMKKKADDINSWDGNCSRIIVSDTQITFANLQEFPDDELDCEGRKYNVNLSSHTITPLPPATGNPVNITCSTYQGNPIQGSNKSNFIYSKSSFGNCFNNITNGTYNVSPSISITCQTSAGSETGCTIKRYGFEPFKDLFGGLGIGKIIRTILIVISVVILAVVIFKVIGYLKNRD